MSRGRLVVAGLLMAALALAVVAFTGSRGGGGPAARPASRPNVLVIVTDDARAETLAVMPKTRRWMGDGGVTFRRLSPVPAPVITVQAPVPVTGTFAVSVVLVTPHRFN